MLAEPVVIRRLVGRARRLARGRAGSRHPQRASGLWEDRAVREQLVAKLRPDRFTAMSGKMAAIVGYILDERFSEPAISELVVTSDGFVLAQAEGEVGANEMLGTEVDLNRNLLDLIAAAGLTAEEIHEFGRLQRKHIRRYRSRAN
jgi:hypothetical protein